MARCSLCSVAAQKLHKLDHRGKISWICTACNSRLNNGRQLNRATSMSRLGLLLNLASITAKLVTAKGRKLLLGKD